MRIDFNLLIIDDDYKNVSGEWINDLIIELQDRLLCKGFKLFLEYLDKIDKDSDITKMFNGRIDYILSDNNIGDGTTGLDIFLDLSNRNKKHDFLLYTKSDKKQVIDMIHENLVKSENPNFLKRFSFVSLTKEPNVNIDIINNIVIEKIDKRIELGSLKFLYSESFAKIETEIAKKLSCVRINLKSGISKCYTRGTFPVDICSELDYHRVIRNSIIHNQEYFNTTENIFCFDIFISDLSVWATKYLKNDDLSKSFIKESEIDTVRSRFVVFLDKLQSYGITVC